MKIVKSDFQLTIIIPLLEDIDSALKTIRSIRSANTKVLIIDGSKINNNIYFKSEKNVLYIHFKDSTIYEAMQEGVRLAETEFVFFAGAGDLIEDIVYMHNSDVTVGQFRIANGPLRDGLMCRVFWRNPLHHQATVYRRSCVSFDLSFIVLGDFDLNIRLIKSNISFAKVNSTFSNIKPHCVSNNFFIAITEGFKVYKKNKILKLYPIYLIALTLSQFKNKIL